MSYRFNFISPAAKAILFGFSIATFQLQAQSNINIRVMAANLNGNSQKYESFAIRIFQGLKPDIIAIQEFNYTSTNGLEVNTPAAIREMIDTAFGTNFVYFRETNSAYTIPNGIISRYPIRSADSWPDTLVGNRGFSWAQIDLPGTNDLYVVSVHLLTSGSRADEAVNLKALMQSAFSSNAWIVLAGDFNAGSRTESTITTFNGYLTDFPIPVDNNGNSDTSANRNSPHDYVLASLSFTNLEAATVLPSHSFPSGLVFDSNVYTPLSDVAPVLAGDSGQAQHMAVMKDFLVPVNDTSTNPPSITTQPKSQIVSPGSNVTFTVEASGASPFSYQWLFNNTNISDATSNFYTLANAQFTNAGNYSVIVTNTAGSVTSSNALLTVSNLPPTIVTQPRGLNVVVGASPTFTVVAGGTAPFDYLWRLGGTNIPDSNTNVLTRNNVQTNDAGDYTVIVTNIAGSATSSVATLSVFLTDPTVIAQWNFNSTTSDANVGTGATTPSVGSGTASLVGGTSATFATGDTVLDPAGANDNSGWNTTSYPAANANNKTAGVKFNVSTAGKQNIVVTWSQRASNTGTKYVRLQYSTNGTSFIDFLAAVSLSAGTVFEPKTNSLANIATVNNNSNFAFRVVAEFENTAAGTSNTNYVAANTGSTYAGATGTLRFDVVTVSGTTIASAASPTLGAPVFATGQFQFTVTGSAGANYTVQTSTNLSVTNWISLFTNISPFTFTDTNTFASPQKFYRAIALP